jgi:hypothetical protein
MSPADNTGHKQHNGRPFEPGQSGNPAGRPKGARNKLSETFLQALADDFDANGKEVIERCGRSGRTTISKSALPLCHGDSKMRR